ncbi:alpha/beta fold hydrolase [Actinoallomurus soli]|uniref:alpha/beta fold hydrolase n=1 Tax=Actinoallomurus soli TaxID=2952535 RepID=UPI002092C3F9|nr:alpha/beta fold hydrolase [Actinoallomurus soli]MCO5974304.1 alpha/beta fold hydrolase [Actinoallomurus soli]
MSDDTRTRRIHGDGVDLAVYERGSGPTVLLVHGYPDTHAVWDAVAARLADRFHVVAYDVRGAGASSRPARREAYGFEHLTADLGAVLDAVSPGAPAHLVGHDWGSIQSWEAVRETPGRFASFTSISGPCLDHAAYWFRTRPRRLSGVPPVARQLLRSWYLAAFQVPVVPELVWRRGLAGRWGRLLERAEGVPRGGGHPAPTLLQDAVAGLNLYRANMLGRSRTARRAGVSPRVTVPTQVIVPTGDVYATPALAAEAPRPFTERLRVRPVATSHWGLLTRPEEFAGLIAEHIDQSSAPDATR